MNYLVIILLLSCIIVKIESICRWTPCEGWLRNDQGICDQYGYGLFAKTTDGKNCKFDSAKRKCCKAEEKTCKWTRCVGDIHGPYACKNQFGNEWRQTSGKERCGSITYKYECCNH